MDISGYLWPVELSQIRRRFQNTDRRISVGITYQRLVVKAVFVGESEFFQIAIL